MDKMQMNEPSGLKGPLQNLGDDKTQLYGFVSGLVGIVVVLFIPFFGLAAGVSALMLGIIARKRLTRSRKGRGLTTTAIVLGICTILIAIVEIIAPVFLRG